MTAQSQSPQVDPSYLEWLGNMASAKLDATEVLASKVGWLTALNVALFLILCAAAWSLFRRWKQIEKRAAALDETLAKYEWRMNKCEKDVAWLKEHAPQIKRDARQVQSIWDRYRDEKKKAETAIAEEPLRELVLPSKPAEPRKRGTASIKR